MRLATSKEMQNIDREAIRSIGIPGPVLMERAGMATANALRKAFAQKRAFIVCGTGNNGGDGLVIARELQNTGYNVKAIMVGNKNRLSPDCALQLSIARKLNIPVSFSTSMSKKDTHGAVVVDALFGTGLDRKVSGLPASVIRKINASGSPVASVDIPSGISADTGQRLGVAVKADLTVTFGLPKRGHFLHPGAANTGRLIVENIGFPPHLFKLASCRVPERSDMLSLLPKRAANAHKGHFGHVLVVAGSAGKTGAAFMAAAACLKAGAGLVTIGGPASMSHVYQERVTEEMYLALPDTGGAGNTGDAGDGHLSLAALEPILSFAETHATVLAIGPGIGTHPDTKKLIHKLIPLCPVPMVLDADALNALEGNLRVLKKAKSPVILTPHPGEFARLTGMDIQDVLRDTISAAQLLAKKSGATVLLKGAPSVVASPSREPSINPTGNPGLAKGGSGDVLTGIVAALMAQGVQTQGVQPQGIQTHESAVLGAYLHGLAADLAVAGGSERSLLASNVIEYMQDAFVFLEDGNNECP